MSQSRSSTPTRNLSSANIQNSPGSTTSRIQPLDDPLAHSQLGIEGESIQQVQLPSSPIAPPLQRQPTPESSTKRRRAEDSSSEASMAKRIRIELSPSRMENRSSPESDSQGDMADNEMDIKALETQEQAPPVPPPKKKRTRQLRSLLHNGARYLAMERRKKVKSAALNLQVRPGLLACGDGHHRVAKAKLWVHHFVTRASITSQQRHARTATSVRLSAVRQDKQA